MTSVVFSDGSKQLAHNNHDLRQRWELRKETQAEDVLSMYENGVSIPQLGTPSSVEEALRWKAQLALQYQQVEGHLALLKQQCADEKDYNQRKQPIVTVLEQIKKQLTGLKDFLAQSQDGRDKSVLQVIHQLRDRIMELEQQVRDLGGVP